MLKRLIWFSMDFPKSTILLVLLATVAFGIQFPKIHIDTDPENMLPADQADRVLYNRAKQEFGIYDLIVLGITDEAGMFQPDTLSRVARVVDRLLGIHGVITADVISLTTTDDVKSKGGLLEVRPLMVRPPENEAESVALRAAIADNPLFTDKLASADGTALAIYIPIESKDQAARIGGELRAILDDELAPQQRYHLAGLPIAEDSFGIEMFRQMEIVSPASGGMLFLLLWIAFRKLTLVVPVMGVAMLAVVWGMGLLIGMGYTVHIMSSMIPVFLMPIAVLDSVHILSDFYDRYPRLKDRRAALRESIGELYTPMLYTSVTSVAGFASLMLADIPPVQVFGAFVAFGILAAFLLTLTLIPASVVLIREERLQAVIGSMDTEGGRLGRALQGFGRFAFSRAVPVALLAALVLGLGFWGVSRTVVNDNPVAWFPESHDLRVADRVMNRQFGGTYMAYLLIEGEEPGAMKRPEVMAYMEGLQRTLETDPKVGKTSSLADVVKQVSYVVHDADPQRRRIPEQADELAQYLFLYETAGDAGDLDNFVDYDYRTANIWVQMQAGDNLEMARVVKLIEAHLKTEPLPAGIHVRWSGLTYINKVWQDEMVVGMMKAVMGGFVAVFVLMVFLFRSLSLGFLSMLPLTFAITLSYGLAAFAGKEYDMPMSVCSALTLGLSIDFAIHFIQRYRHNLARLGGDGDNRGAFLDTFYYAGEDQRTRVSMRLINPQGKERKREMTLLRKNLGAAGEQRYYIYFHEPADVKGTAFMVWKYPAREDDRWIFIPAIKLVRRIAADDKRSSFVGSDFTYEDVSGRDAADETHSLVGEETLDGRPVFKIESLPKAKVDYARRLSWIDRERGLPLKEEYYDVRAELLRTFTTDEVREVDGHWTATRRTMHNAQSGHRTEVVFDEVSYGVGLGEELFSERYLQRPPRQWIR